MCRSSSRVTGSRCRGGRSLEGRQSSAEIPPACYRCVVDCHFRALNESAGPFGESDVGLFVLGLEDETDWFALEGGVFGSAPHDHVVPLVRDGYDGDACDRHAGNLHRGWQPWPRPCRRGSVPGGCRTRCLRGRRRPPMSRCRLARHRLGALRAPLLGRLLLPGRLGGGRSGAGF